MLPSGLNCSIKTVPVTFEKSTHPELFVEAKGHGVCALRYSGGQHCKHSTSGSPPPFPGGDGIVYRYKGGKAEVPKSGKDNDAGYKLVPLATTLWARRKDICDNGCTFDQTMTYEGMNLGQAFDGDTHGKDKANPPWAWDVPGYGTALLWEKNMSQHDAFVSALIAELKGKYNVASQKIYIVGFSSGGFYVSHLFPSYSSQFAAFAMHGACSWSTYYDPPSKAARKIPGFVRVGSADSQFLSCAQQLKSAMLAAGWKSGVDLDYAELPGVGHTYSSGQNSAQWQFFNKFSLP